MYGGGFSTLPAFLGDLFGTKQLGAIHGMVLAAWGLAGVVGPTIYDMVKKQTGSLDTTLIIFAGLFVIALIISILMKRLIEKAHKQQEQELKLAPS
jgi:OFA family oxalate/formate antiporter-like MFS transporter